MITDELANTIFEYPSSARISMPLNTQRRPLPLTLIAAVMTLVFFGGLRVYAAGYLPGDPNFSTGHSVGLAQAEETPDSRIVSDSAVISAANAAQIERIDLIQRDFLRGAMAWSPDGQLLAVAHAEGILLYDTNTFTLPRLLEIEGRVWLKIFFTPDSKRLAVLDDSPIVRLYDAATGQEVIAFEGHETRVLDAAFSPDGVRLATAGQDKTARLWDAASGQELRVFEGHNSPVTSIAFSPDGATVASASGDVRLWDAESGQQTAIFSIRGMIVPTINNLIFSPAGDVIVTTQGARVHLWDVVSGNELLVIEDQESMWNPDHIALSRDGTLLAVVRRNVVQLWDTRSGELLGTLEGGEDKINTVAFSPHGTVLAFSAGFTRSSGVWLWGVAGD